MKVLLSVGGTTFSPHFALPASTTSGRLKFATSVRTLIEDLGLDGVDIDWEYPANSEQGADMVSLLKEVQQALRPNNFTVSVACPGPFGYRYMLPAQMDQYVDFWNLMAYDYSGSWSNITGNQANLFRSINIPESTPFDTESVIAFYTSRGVSLSKIVLGIPLFGRYFNNTSGLGKPFAGSGSYSIKDLPLVGAKMYYDWNSGSSYSYNAAQGQLVSYDNMDVVKQKAAFILNMLGGAMYWESSEDGTGNESVVRAVTSVLGGDDSRMLNKSLNQLFYPGSRYDNIRDGLPASSLTRTPSPATSFITSSILPSTSVAMACSVGDTFFWCNALFCMCVLSPSRQPSCFVIESYCYNTICSNNSECGSDEICWTDNRCTDGTHCVQVVPGGCIDNPVMQ